MATAVGVKGRNVFREIADTFWQATGRYGFFPQRNNAVNQEISLELEEKVAALVLRLKVQERAVCTRRSLDHLIFSTAQRARHPRSPHGGTPTQVEVPNSHINELTLVYACILLRYTLRGISEDAVLRELKEIARWLLMAFGYDLPAHDYLFYEKSLRWADQEFLWKLVDRNDNWELYFDSEFYRYGPTIPMTVL